MEIKVLIADDHAVMRDGLRLIIGSQSGMAVAADVANGREAVAQAQALRPDVAVLDIAMPEMNGIDAAIRIREISPGTRIVMLSMHSTSEYIFRALDAGAQAYLLKESAGREVVEAIRSVCAGRRYLSQTITETVLEDYIRHRRSMPELSPLDRLSQREREVLQLAAEGKTSREIANILHLSSKTVDTYRSRLMAKLEVEDIQGLIRFAIAHGLTKST